MRANYYSDIKKEFYRKLIHLFSTIIPIIYTFTSYKFIVLFVGIGTVLMIAIDFFKGKVNLLGNFYLKILRHVLRNDELNFKKKIFTGGTWYALGIFLTLLLFQKEIAIIAVLIMIWADTSAAIFGKLYGSNKFFSKSLEGSISFFLTGIIIIIILNFLNNFSDNFLIVLIISMFFTSIVEALDLKINDNLIIPLFFSLLTLIQKNFFNINIY